MATKTETKVAVVNNPGVLVLQWLTYAFWGFTVLALAWLTAISVGYFIDSKTSPGYDESTSIAYSLAAVVVLFLISVICDFFYSRVEPLAKHGGAMVIMIIHAVLFALFGIGALIVAVFAIVRLLIGDGTGSSYGDDSALTTLITGSVIAVVYGATLLRVLRPFKLKRSGLVYWIFMTIVTITITTLGIVGPTANARETRDDRLIENNLYTVSDAISGYYTKNQEGPKDLAAVRGDVSEQGRVLIDRNLVEYKPGKIVPVDLPSDTITTPEASNSFEYQLCVTFKAAKHSGGQSYPATDIGGRQVSPNTYDHDAGRVCYDLQTSYYYGYPKPL